ncbi:hypothetical protein P3S68_031852 [Capsicum galapagoense]
MDRKNVIPKQKDDTAGSSRKRRAVAVEKVSKRKKIEESVSESDSKLKEISDYVDSSEDVAKRSKVFDEKQKTSYALFGFSWAFMIWIYEAFPHLGEFAGKSMDEPLPIPRILRWHTSKRDKIIEGDPFKYKGKVTENVHPYIIPTICETNMDFMITFESYTDEMKNNVLDGLKKELERVTVLTSNEDSDDDEDLGGNPVGVRVGDDDSPSTSKDAAGTSSLGDFHKCMAALEEAVLDIAAYIKEKRMKKKENDKRQHGRAEEETTIVGEVRKEGGEEKETEEEAADAHAEKEGEECENEEAAAIVEKKEVEAVLTDELRERDI